MPAAAALKKAELSILLTSDEKIQKLNRDWRNKDQPTDVLSFPLATLKELHGYGRAARRLSGRIPTWWLGDIVISLDRAKAQAEERGHSLYEELELLLAHGLLHLLDYDHERGPEAAVKMRSLEQKLLGRSMIH